jgi:HK97 family phage prohead protease
MENKEKRSANFTVRAEKDSRTITGTAAVYDSWTTIGGGSWAFREKITDSAFTESLKSTDVVATFNHDFNMPMARTESNSLEVWSDKMGLHYRFDAPNTNSGDDLLENVRNGNILGGSIMFSIEKNTWTWAEGDELDERVIEKGSLFELGPVTMPAYKDTSVSARSEKDSYDATLKEAKQDKEDAKATTLTLQLQRKRNSTK